MLKRIKEVSPLLLVLLCLTSFSAHAEKFVAKARFTLIDPASITSNEQTQTIQLPSEHSGTLVCEIDPQTGKLSGDQCGEASNKQAKLDINGKPSQTVNVNISQAKIEHSHSQISYQPRLYNGANSDSEFQLRHSSQVVALGGQISKKSASNNTYSSPEAMTHDDASVLIKYDVEVLYP